jgi:hypothetical protein
MKQVLKILLLGLISAIFILGLFIFANLENKEPIEKVQTRTILAETVTKDLAMIDFNVMYEGGFPEYSDYAIKSIVRQIVLKKNVLEILKQNSLEFIEDTLEYIITPIDSAFNVLSIQTKYYLRPEVQELWDEYITTKIEAVKAEEKARNLKILYGE